MAQDAMDRAGWRLQAGDPEGAALELGALWRQGTVDPALTRPLASLWGAIQGALGREDVAAIVEQALAGDFEAWPVLAAVALDLDLPALAATFAGLAYEGDEDPAVLLLWAQCLADAGRPAEARDLLEGRADEVRSTFFGSYLLAFCAAMGGDLEEAGSLVEGLEASDDDEALMVDRIRGWLRRAEAIEVATGLGPEDLRGWTYTLNGALVLRLAEEDDPRMGRYGLILEELEAVTAVVARLVALLRARGLVVDRLGAPSDRDSQIYAHAVASVLGVPVVGPGAGAPLVVAWDLRPLSGPERLAVLAPGHWLHVHGLDWRDPPELSPDSVGLLHEALVAPWTGRPEYDEDQGTWGYSAADDGDPADLGARLASIPPDERTGATADSDEVYLSVVELVGPTAGPDPDRSIRERWWAMGPVASPA